MIRDFGAFDGAVWRLLPAALADTPAVAAQAPEGRFHHTGQVAAYASLSAVGARVAIQRYLTDHIARKLLPMRLIADRVADVSDDPAASVIWQDIRATGARSPTWDFSDTARKMGAQAMVHASRSRPELRHVVVFDPTCLHLVGPATDLLRTADM